MTFSNPKTTEFCPEIKKEPTLWHCQRCKHKNDTHSFNCVECCPIRMGA